MTVTPAFTEVASGETVAFTVRCAPFERLWRYEIWHGLVGPPDLGADISYNIPGQMPAPGQEAAISIPTTGWAAREPPGYSATYTIRFSSVTCAGGSSGSPCFGFPHLNEFHHDRRDFCEARVRVRNSMSIPRDRVTACLTRMPGTIGVFDPATSQPALLVKPGVMHLVVVNLRWASFDAARVESAVRVGYVPPARGMGIGRGPAMPVPVAVVFLDPRRLATGTSGVFRRKLAWDALELDNILDGGCPVPTLREIGMTTAELSSPFVIPFQVPAEVDDVPAAGRLTFGLHIGGIDIETIEVGMATGRPVARQGTPRGKRVFRGALVLYGGKDAANPLARSLARAIPAFKREFERATDGLFALDLEGPFLLERIGPFGVSNQPPPLMSLIGTGGAASQSVPSARAGSRDIRAELKALAGLPGSPRFLAEWDDKGREYTLFVVSDPPGEPGAATEPWSPCPGLVLAPPVPDPAEPGRDGSYPAIRAILREFGRLSLGPHRAPGTKVEVRLAGARTVQALPFPSETAMIADWSAISDDAAGGMFHFDPRAMERLSSAQPGVVHLGLEFGDVPAGQTGKRHLNIRVVVRSPIEPLRAVTISAISKGREVASAKREFPKEVRYLFDGDFALELGNTPGRDASRDVSGPLTIRVGIRHGQANGPSVERSEQFEVDPDGGAR